MCNWNLDNVTDLQDCPLADLLIPTTTCLGSIQPHINYCTNTFFIPHLCSSVAVPYPLCTGRDVHQLIYELVDIFFTSKPTDECVQPPVDGVGERCQS